MNRPFAFLVALLALSNVAIAVESKDILSAKGPLVLRLEQAPLLFQQCSRGAPKPEGSLWLPTAAEVGVLETMLEKHIAAIRPGSKRVPNEGYQYRGQYVGFTRGNVKHIYGSYTRAERDVSSSRRGDAIIVCDGGRNHWGIVYNVATGEFSEFEANGR